MPPTAPFPPAAPPAEGTPAPPAGVIDLPVAADRRRRLFALLRTGARTA